ncbi:MAG TPA: 16S rRNA (cytidine(1402)-2'-O)-methyltransferase [Acidimicrobiia bacterium]|nr:16S rRNA (cytidine(1402)-2'-O)-methyltransferase [Acidimicrobiia bacterium]
MPELRFGALVLVGTPIGNLGDLSPRAIDALRDADVIAAEDTRRTRALLTHAEIAGGNRVRAVHAHNEQEAAEMVVREVRAGKRVAYVTDAGMPGISDPGSRLVRACLDAGLPVEVVPGPSAALSALVLSGFPTERFAFEGFLPRRGRERKARLAEVASDTRTTVLFESPRRVAATIDDLRALCGPLREVAIARELTKRFEDVWRGTLGDAVDLAGDGPPRGEHVIVLSPVPAAPEASDEEIDAHVRAALGEGLSARDAAVRVGRDLGVPRRRAYEIAIALRRR